MNRARMKEWTEILVPWVQVLALLAGGIFAVREYRDHTRELKIQRAMDYLLRSSSEDLLSARFSLSKREQKMTERFRSILLDSSLSRDAKNRAYFDFVVQELIMHGKDDGLEVPFYNILAYFDEGVTCIQQGLCDEMTIKSGLSDFGQSFVRTYTPYLCYLRRAWNDPTIGRRVENFYNPSAKQACDRYYESIQRTSLTSDQQHP